MKSSILITSYNKGKYIDECISSCINQDIADDIEILVLDNYSEDNSDQIFSKYKDKIKIFKKKRVSTYPALNQIDLIKEGLKISSGNLIYLLDGDDFFLKNKVKTILEEFKKDKSLNFIQDNPIYFYPNNNLKLKKKIEKKILCDAYLALF